MPRPLKILFLMEDLCYGGTQKQNLELARRLDPALFSPSLLTLTGQTDLDPDAAPVPVRNMGSSRRVTPFFYLRLPFFLNQLAPDIIVPCTALPNIWGRIWGRALGRSLVVGTCRGGGAPGRQHEWLLGRLPHGIVCNSQPLMEIMVKNGIPRSKLRYIPNGVDTDHFQPRAKLEKDPAILCVGRLARDKDHKTLLAAFARVAPEYPDARLIIVGEGPEEAGLMEFCREKLAVETAARVEFAGASHDPAPYYEKAAIFALSSIREGQPNVILEAMSCGLPVCATNVGGIPGLVTDNGYLSPPGDVDAMAANLRRLLADPDLREKMGQAGRIAACRDFSFAAMTARHEEFFLELWEQKK